MQRVTPISSCRHTKQSNWTRRWGTMRTRPPCRELGVLEIGSLDSSACFFELRFVTADFPVTSLAAWPASRTCVRAALSSRVTFVSQSLVRV
jgi:hypothetical protein